MLHLKNRALGFSEKNYINFIVNML